MFLLLEIDGPGSTDVLIRLDATSRVVLRADTLAAVANKLDEMHHTPPDEDAVAAVARDLVRRKREAIAKYSAANAAEYPGLLPGAETRVPAVVRILSEQRAETLRAQPFGQPGDMTPAPVPCVRMSGFRMVGPAYHGDPGDADVPLTVDPYPAKPATDDDDDADPDDTDTIEVFPFVAEPDDKPAA